VVKFIGFLDDSRIQGCFHWLSSPIGSGVLTDQNYQAVAYAGLKRLDTQVA